MTTIDEQKETPPGNESSGAFPTGPRRFSPIFISLLLALVTLATFWPVRYHGFITFDDPNYITANSHVQGGMKWVNVKWAFTNFEAGFWHPLTWLSIMLDCQLFGLRAGYHHLTSLLFHAANTVLLFVILRRMTAAIWRSAFVAALFALHPLHVETVAWAADRKDVLSTFFALLTLWAYARYAQMFRADIPASEGQGEDEVLSVPSAPFRGGKIVWYFTALVLFACAVMSKTMVVTLPLVFLLLDWWPLRRWQPPPVGSCLSRLKPLILEKLLFFAISLAAGLVTLHAERTIGALSDATEFPIQLRAANAVLSCWRYLGEMFWPRDLAVFYPYPARFSIGLAVAGAVLLLLVSTLILRVSRAKPYLTVGWFWYLVTLLPVIGVIQVGFHSHADRYTYLPLIGIFAVAAWGGYDLTRNWKAPFSVVAVAGIAIIVLCAGLTRRQLAYWQDSETLLRHAIRVTRNNFIAYNNLGLDLLAKGKTDEAISCFRDSIRSKPSFPNAHSNLGQVLGLRGSLEEAAKEFRESLRFRPGDARIHSNLGDVLGTQGKFPEATLEYRDALRLNPALPGIHRTLGMALAYQGNLEEAMEQYAEAIRSDPQDAVMHERLGIELAKKGRLDEAVTHFRETVRINPKSPGAHSNLGKALMAQNKLDDAIKEYQESIRFEPNDSVAQNNLGVAMARTGKLDDAITHFHEAIRLNPNYANAHSNLGKVLAAQNKPTEAIAEYRESLRLEPDDAGAHNSLANLLAKGHRVEEAIGHYKEASRLDPGNPQAHYNLGVALAKAGHIEDAIAQCTEALRLKPNYAEAQRKLSELDPSRKPTSP